MNTKTQEAVTQERLHELFDYRDGNLYWKQRRKNWILVGQIAGTKTPKRYANLRVDGHFMKLHRAIFMYHHGYLPDFVDHINGITTDNRIENLRACTKTQNGQNQTNRPKTRNTFFKNGRYGVALKVNGKQIHIGYFGSQEEAIKAAEQARKQHFGEFA